MARARTWSPGAATLTERPLPIEPVFTIREVAALLSLKVAGVRHWLITRPDLFDRPRYRRLGTRPERHRVLSATEVRTLQALVIRP